MNVNGYQTAIEAENELTLQRYVAGVMRKVYGKMTLGLLATAVTSFLVLSSPALMGMLFSSMATIWILFALEIGLVIYLSARIDKLSTGTATALFYVYSILNGVALTPIFLAYTGTSIALTFAITAGTFGAMTVAGYFTKTDLTKFGSYLFMGLLGLIVCIIVNMFLHNSMFDLLISVAGVIIFVGLTAWDTQSIKRMCAQADPSMMGKVATMGALSLYLDFINLFLYLLRFLGSRD
ncbi:MAG: Bax inhibitor-1/YccA family protein [Muribaculaceae bacterium]|nr:Bax inhibitor-1/YccA family protein [Muribaculaceae bacterium]